MGGKDSLLCEVRPTGIWKVLDAPRPPHNSQILHTPFHFSTCFFLRSFFSKKEGLCYPPTPPRTHPDCSAKAPEAGLVSLDTHTHFFGPTKIAAYAVRERWSKMIENVDFGVGQTWLQIPTLSLNFSVTSDKWPIHSKPQFLIKWEWSLK